MHEIIITQSNGKPTADSLMIAEHFDKRHDHVLRDITALADIPNFGEMFISDTYSDSYGRQQRMYRLTRDGFSLLVMGFTGARALDWKLRYIEAFNRMESHVSTVRIPQTFAEALRLAADQADLLEKQRPLVEFANACAKSNSAILIRELAKIISDREDIVIGEKRLWQLLRDWGLIFPKSTEPYQAYIDRGYFEVSQGVHENASGSFLHKTTRVLPKGQVYIIDRLRKGVEKRA